MKIILNSPPEITRRISGRENYKISFRVYFSRQDTPGPEPSEIMQICGSPGDPFPVNVDNNNFMRDNSIIVTAIDVKPESANIALLEFHGCKCPENISPAGPVVTRIDSHNSISKTAVFDIPASRINQDAPAPGDDATAWAGSGFFCDSVKIIRENNAFCRVVVTAKENAAPRMLFKTNSESHAGYDAMGARRSDNSWKSVWSVPSEILQDFIPQCGMDASEWAGPQSFVSRITAEQKSDREYLVTLEADSIFNSFPTGSLDDRSNLKSRVDINVAFSDFFITPQEAGYIMAGDGSMILRNMWTPDECPIVTGSRIAFFDRPLKTMLVAETRFYKGGTGEHLKIIAEWHDGNPIFSGKIGKYNANWLKQDIKAEDIMDNQGEIWTSIERVYRHPPAGYEWNSTYWAGR